MIGFEEMHYRFDTHYAEPKNKLSVGDIFIGATVAFAMTFLMAGFFFYETGNKAIPYRQTAEEIKKTADKG